MQSLYFTSEYYVLVDTADHHNLTYFTGSTFTFQELLLPWWITNEHFKKIWCFFPI